MTGWGAFTAAWAVFLLSHALPVRAPVKPWLVARLGAAGFALAYSALSLAALAWLIIAAGRAPHVALWPAPAQAHWIVALAMVAACLLLALSLGRPNPFSFGGARNAAFDPDRPGTVALTRHPVLLALALWALAHLAVIGNLAHVLLFGGFLGFALLGMRMIDRRRRREMGPARWQDTVARTRRAGMTWPPGSAWRVALGLGAPILLIGVHRHLSGVAIWPRFLP